MYLLLYTYRAFGWCLHAKQRTGFTTCYAMTKGKFPYLCNAGSKLRRNYGAMLCLGLGTYMLEAWEKWRQNAISHMSYHFVARFNISKHSTTAQLSYFSPHCRRSMILMPTAPKATAAAATVAAAAAYVGGKWRNDKNSLSYIGRACHWLGIMGWDPF